MIGLRPASMRDADTLFAWRNDPVTLACFKSTAAVPREDHDRWMQFNVSQGYPQHLVLIAQSENESIGVVRFDADRGDVMVFNVSITIAPKYRGKGLAGDILASACGHMQDYTLNADIRIDNIPSQRIFEGCGFLPVGRDGEFSKYRRYPL